MSKKKWIILICASVFGLIAMNFVMVHYPLIRFYPKYPEFESGEMWVSDTNDICIKSVYDEEDKINRLVGTIETSDETFEFEGFFKGSSFYFEDSESNTFYLLMRADYKIKKNGDILLTDIYYDEDIDWKSKPKKILLKKQ